MHQETTNQALQHAVSPAAPVGSVASSFDIPQPATKRKRGSYNCGRCGLPKKGHTCHLSATSAVSPAVATPTSTVSSATSSTSLYRQPHPHRNQHNCHPRALYFDDVDMRCDSPEPEVKESDSDLLPPSLMWEVLRRLPPTSLLSAAGVCKGWRDTARRLWKAAEELRFRVPLRVKLRFIGSLLQKCPALVKLNLRMESDVDATMLACIAFSCPNLEVMEISTSDTAVNRITGDELGRFVADRRCLLSLKMEGCSHLGGFVACSSSLSTLWLSDINCLSKMVFNCPNLKEISLGFSGQENDNTDLVSLVDSLGRGCPRLQNIRIASCRFSHAAVLALTAANLRSLRMLSLVLGTKITDASVAAIASSYSKLELLDLSGSSISDNGIGMICNVFSGTLSRLLLALCPNITSSGIQFATAQLPSLELMDCGMTICGPSSPFPTPEQSSDFLSETFKNNLHHVCQKLIIKHSRLKKLSLWGCSGLDALCLTCPQLSDLNLNSCRNLHPDGVLLQCPDLETVHASGCHQLVVAAIESQVSNNFPAMENYTSKRLADGSKRIRVPNYLGQQSCDDAKKRSSISGGLCKVIVD